MRFSILSKFNLFSWITPNKISAFFAATYFC